MIADTVISIVVESLFLIQVGISFIRGGRASGEWVNLKLNALNFKKGHFHKIQRYPLNPRIRINVQEILDL